MYAYNFSAHHTFAIALVWSRTFPIKCEWSVIWVEAYPLHFAQDKLVCSSVTARHICKIHISHESSYTIASNFTRRVSLRFVCLYKNLSSARADRVPILCVWLSMEALWHGIYNMHPQPHTIHTHTYMSGIRRIAVWCIHLVDISNILYTFCNYAPRVRTDEQHKKTCTLTHFAIMNG